MSTSRHLSNVASALLGCEVAAADTALSGSEDARAFFAGGEALPSTLVVSYSHQGDLLVTTGNLTALTSKAVYFVRLSAAPLTSATVESDVSFGTLDGSRNTLCLLGRLLTEVYSPNLSQNTFAFQNQLQPNQLAELSASNGRCVTVCRRAVESLVAGLELAQVAPSERVANTPASIAAAAAIPAKVHAYEEIAISWAEMVEGALLELEVNPPPPPNMIPSAKTDRDKGGPRSELTYWRNRMGKLNSLVEQLKGETCRETLAVMSSLQPRALKRWRLCELALAEAANEANDNIKYLFALDKHIEPLYSGSPAAVLEALPGLLNNIWMMHAIARYYATPARMTSLFRKIGEQMIQNCRLSVESGGSLWSQPTASLIAKLRVCVETNREYQAQYRALKSQLAANPEGKQWDFNEGHIFGRFELLYRRVEKLVDLFSTVEQFAALAKHNFEGLESLLDAFFSLVDNFKRKPYALLDFGTSQFDRDYLEFNANIHELESSVQGFINASFERIGSTDKALALLRKLRMLLRREALKDDLESKLMVILNHFGRELETVQRLYEKQKASPPASRNMPPVAANILWARQLRRRIEGPMREFAQHANLMATKEAKKLIKVYDKSLRTLTEYEMLWRDAWAKGFDAATSGLQATLLVQHPTTGDLTVNFDRTILQLLKECKGLKRMGLEVPEPAKLVFLQEDKFKRNFDLLVHTLGEYERVLNAVLPVAAPLLAPHRVKLQRAIQPGLVALTWTSMSISVYLHSFHSELERFEELAAKIGDVIGNRITRTLRTVAAVPLAAPLPSGGERCTLEQWVDTQERLITIFSICHALFSPYITENWILQERHAHEQTAVIAAKKIEVEAAVADLIALVAKSPVQNNMAIAVDPIRTRELSAHFAELWRRAVLQSTREALRKLRRRMDARAVEVSQGSFSSQEVIPAPGRPMATTARCDAFMDMDVELQMPGVIITPPPDEIRAVVSRSARAILGISKALSGWGQANVAERISNLVGHANGGNLAPADVAIASDVGVAIALDEGYASQAIYASVVSSAEIVRELLLLRGSIEGAKRSLSEYLRGFSKHVFLWREDKTAVYDTFTARGPTLDDFEDELLRAVSIEAEIERVPARHAIGALALETAPLKIALRREAAAWKALYAQNLHAQAKRDLDDLVGWMQEMGRFLRREVGDLHDVRTVMRYLADIREMESRKDWSISPLTERYDLLRRNGALVPKEESDLVADLDYSWRKLNRMADELTTRLQTMQAGFRIGLERNVRAFAADVIHFRDAFDAHGPGVLGLKPIEACERLRRFQRLFEERVRKFEGCRAGEALFGMPLTEYPVLNRTRLELCLLKKLYGLYSRVLTTVFEFGERQWGEVKESETLGAMISALEGFGAEMNKMPKELRSWAAFGELKRIVETYLESLPLAQMLAHPAMRARHWEMLAERLGQPLYITADSFKLASLLEVGAARCGGGSVGGSGGDAAAAGCGGAGAQGADGASGDDSAVHTGAISTARASSALAPSRGDVDVALAAGGLKVYSSDVEEIAGAAVKEEGIEKKLKELNLDWGMRNLTLAHFKSRGLLMLNGSATAELIEALEEAQMNLGSMMASRFVLPFKETVAEWILKLSTVSEILETWLQVQSMWQYLEVVFTSGDIARQLPQESKRFAAIDKNWIKMMGRAAETPNVIGHVYGNGSLKQLLPQMLEQLELCQKALSGYLDQKRSAFPRFFFVADATLLEILSQGSNPQAIQSHLASVFDAIERVTFDTKDRNLIIEIASAEDEIVKLASPVRAEGNIEEWLLRLLNAMMESVNGIIAHAALECECLATEELTHKYQSQVALLAIQMKWTLDSEEALYRSRSERSIMAATNKRHNARLGSLVAMNMRDDAELRAHGSWTRKKVETLILVDVHQRDVFEEVVRKRVRDPEDFEWQKQARFYWRHDVEHAQVSVADVDFRYMCEYLGVKDRLVITPLTDRCYITLSQALGMCLGGAPAGPAGTGKTETTKDMGCTLGKYVVVTNCSDQMDFRALGGIYKGLAMSGCWGCFDEFNRIDLEVLSVAAQQVLSVLNAVRDDKPSFKFTDGTTTALNREVGYFITMNPGYAGRQELPENLKSLFRGVTMMVPDREIIMKVKLTGCGYIYSALLAKKFNVLYRLCEEQLSKQPHYDFGLRNILAVLRTAGASRRAAADLSERGELLLMMRTLRDMNLSKFMAEDVPLFLALIDDLFPGERAEKAQHPRVESEIAKVVRANGLQMHPQWLAKILQLYEMSLVRHSMMAVGPSGVGKSLNASTLQTALSQIAVSEGEVVQPMWGQPHKEVRMNPKAVTAPQMFGSLDVLANEWTEGVFAQLWRKANRDRKHFTWLVLDGPVDAIWIENMNTVMDDNRILTLANNDRIPMLRPNVTLHFEVEDLRNASPATVSRAGIIYISEADLGWRPYVATFLACRPHDLANLRVAFDTYTDSMLTFVRRECKSKMAISEISLISSLCVTLESLTQGLVKPPSQPALERYFLYSLMWSVAGVLEADDRARVDAHLHTLTENLPAASYPDTCFEFAVSASGSHEWTHWGKAIPQWRFHGNDIAREFASLSVPTIDSVRLEYNIGNSLNMLRPVLLVGSSGTAKTASILQVLGKQRGAHVSCKKLSFSSVTSSLLFQRAIEGCVEKRQGKTWGPPGGKRMLVFVDDFSMPEVNAWGDQPTLEIVRQLIEQMGLYNLEKPGEWKSIVDLTLMGAMLHPGAGKNDIPNRAKRHFHIMNVTLPSEASIHQIFGALVHAKFSPDQPDRDGAVWARAEALVASTVVIWRRVMAKMLPTPERFHYVFNLRDLSRVFQGVFMAPLSTLTSEQVLLKLWKHECHRVFCDRLVSHADKEWFSAEIDLVLEETTDADAAAPLKGEEDAEMGEHLPAPKVYEPVNDVAALRSRIYKHMRSFNSVFKLLKTELVFFADCLEHVLRVSRIFAMSRGNALLVGVGGSGKQSLARLCAFIGNFNCFQSVITRAYSANDLLEDFKPLYRRAGVAGQGCVFLVTDREIKEEGFLEYINIFLNTGELPNLFARDEFDAILGEIGAIYARDARKGGKEGTPSGGENWGEASAESLWAYFIERVRANLHLALCFSPVGAKFRTRAQRFPGLINGCTIDWYMPWPLEALSEMATARIDEFDTLRGKVNVRERLIDHFAFVHTAMTEACVEHFHAYRRHTYVTPKSYLGFICEYKEVYAAKLAHIEGLAEKVNNGLTKLHEAGEDVERMRLALQEKEQTLVEAQKKSALLLQDITASTAKAERKKGEVKAVKDALAVEAKEIAVQKDVVEKDLEVAKPMLEESENALKSITAKDINLLKSFKQPPDLVKRVFDVVLILFKMEVVPTQALEAEIKGTKRLQLEASWKHATALMGDIGFLPSVLQFNKDEINDETVELVYPYFSLPDMTPEDARKVANALAGLCTWARAMALYVDIAKVVKPKMEALAEAEGKLRGANAKLATAQTELDGVQAELDAMQRQFEEAVAERQRLQEDADNTQRRMDAANKLINGLSSERTRWRAQSEAFADEIMRLAGDAALACAFVAYAGPFNSVFRDKCQKTLAEHCAKVANVPMTPELQVSAFLVDETVIGDWTLEGLPSDELSVQNGIMVTRSRKWPLLIDPQSQGLEWLRAREGGRGLTVTSTTEKRFRNHLEDSMVFGTPLIIERIGEDLDPMLDPVLNKEIQKKGRSLIVQLADKECEYSDTFRLFLCSKLGNPHFSPEIFAQLTVINFTVTMEGLEHQLLNRVLRQERAELEDQKQSLVEEVKANQKLLNGLEDDLLSRLAGTTGNLLDDSELVDVLQRSKTASVEVQEKLTTAAETEKRIGSTREEYRPVATRGSLLYFLVVDMAAVNNMYMVSLQQYLSLFDLSIGDSERAPLAVKRVANIREYLTYSVTCYMQRGLFERHKHIWTLMLAIKVERVAGRLSAAYVSNLLKGGGSLDVKTERPKPHEWMPDSVWMNCLSLGRTVPALASLPDSLGRLRAAEAWRCYYDDDAPETVAVPGGLGDGLDAFERMLIVRAIREDRTMLSAQEFVIDRLGSKFVESRPLDFAAMADEASERTPIVVLLTMGSDPTGSIQDLAKKRKKCVVSISLGQGQEPAARRLLAMATAAGDWLLLQNCHLGLGFMHELEGWLVKWEGDEPALGFRLWITAEPHPHFPIGLLQLALKVTNEAPAGVKAGLRGSYAWITQDTLDSISQPQWRTMLFALCFLHTVVQERRKFGPLGFNVPYEFNKSDLSASVQFLQNHLNDVEAKRRTVDWTVVNYMICEVQYGGRITDDWDRRLFNTYGRAWLTRVCLENDFQFADGYAIPANKPDHPGTDINHFRKYIETLPLVDDPDIFGLHSNAELAFRALETKQMLGTILDIQPKERRSGGVSREEQVLGIVEGLQAKMPPNYEQEAVKQAVKALGGMGKPLNICLKQEIDRLQKVLTVLRTGLRSLTLGIAGTIVMSPDLVETLDALAMARVPAAWTKVSQLLAPNVGAWFSTILKRAEQLTQWLRNGRPLCFWLTGFFNPSGFLTANRQEVCRRHSKENWALDDVINFSRVLPTERDDVKKPPEEGVYLHGLFLDGAKWDKHRGSLVDSDPKMLFTLLPVLWVSGTLALELKGDQNTHYTCPVYKSPKRTGLNFITSVNLRTEGDEPSKWVLRGVALLTSTD